MKTQSFNFPIIALALGVGLVLGALLSPSQLFSSEGDSDAREGVRSPVATKSNHQAASALARGTRSIWNEMGGLDIREDFDSELRHLQLEPRSPLRAQSLLHLKFSHSRFEEWEELIKMGSVKGIENVEALADYLAKEDLSRMIDIFLKGNFRFQTLDEVYAFRAPITKVAIETGQGVYLMNQIQEMRPGGSRQDFSQYFRRQWASKKPAEAVKYFDELVELRDMGKLDSKPTRDYANRIMGSWLKKDSEAAQDYIANAPASEATIFLTNALEAQLKKGRKK